MKKLTLKNIVIYSAIFLLSAALFSCGQKKADTNVFRMNLSSEPDSFFPWKSSAADTKAILYNIYEGLTTFDKTGAIKPCLAKSYSASSDGLTYTFKLRDDVYFHNGKKLTGSDVLYTYKNLAGLDGLTATSDEMKIIKNAYLKDESTFVVELKQSTASFLSFAIQPILQEGYQDNESQPNGTGPYKFSKYVIHQKVILEKNENYWNKTSEPTINRIELYIMSDEAALISALRSDQLDMIQLISAKNAKALEGDFEYISYPQNMVQIFAMNNAIEPFNNPKVRKAIALAVNKHEIIEGALDGAGTELYSNFSPVLRVFYNEKLTGLNPYDIKKAKELLKEAGYEKGFNLKIKVPSNYTVHVDTAQIIAKQLAEIGIKAEIEGIEWGTWLNDVYTNKDFEATVIAFGGKLEPNDILKRYSSSYKRNFVGFNNSEYDQKLSAALTELNESKRIKLYKDCQQILAEECPCVFISDPNNTVLKKHNLRGFTYYPVSFYDFSKLYYSY